MAAIRMLREGDFNSAGREGHINDHSALHHAYNHAVYVDDYDSVAAALNEAKNKSKNHVIFTPGAIYEISEVLNVYAGLCLHGGGSFGVNGAIIKATRQIDTILTMATQTAMNGLVLNGNYLAINGVELTGDRHVLQDNSIGNIGERGTYSSAAILCRGILYPHFFRNVTTSINGWALKGLASDGVDYYGINVGLSQMNIWQGRAGALYLEGILTSVSDDFEMAAHEAVIKTGTVSSRIKMASPYFEVSGAAPVVEINGSGRVLLRDGEAFGDSVEANRGDFVKMNSAYQLQIENMSISRFAKLVSGVSANNARLVVRDCIVGNVAENMPDNWNISAAAHKDLQWE